VSTISNFHLLLNSLHVPADGSEVAGPGLKPTNPTFAQILSPVAPVSPDVEPLTRMFLVSGGIPAADAAWSDAEFYPANGIPDQGYAGGPISITWVFTPRSDLTDAQCHETTLIWISPKGLAFNGSFQINCALGGEIQTSSFNEGWTSTGEIPGVPEMDVQHTLTVSYDFNVDTGQRICLGATLDGRSFTIPAEFQSVAATPSTWAKNIFMPQYQLDQTKSGDLICVELNEGCSISF
jgi:hypothetical protein